MNPAPICPVCENNDWEEIAQKCYNISTLEEESEYVQRRLHVLFELWAPNASKVTLRYLLCRDCGFITYSPRPSERDIHEKYKFISELPPDSRVPPTQTPAERLRANRLWRKFKGRLPKGKCRVLDFGGGDGRLMVPFASNGHRCFVIDYIPETVAGVERLGDTLDAVPPSDHFHATVCSHVIEHVAAPFEILRDLFGRLYDGGIIYVEVPLEIWRKAPVHEEPVTHVNFFTVESLKVLMSRVGFCDLRVRMEEYLHPLGHRTVVIAAFGRRVDGCRDYVSTRGAADATRSLLHPGFKDRMQRAMLRPSAFPQAVLHRIRRISRENRR